MGANASSAMQSEGTVNGRPATFHYSKTNDDDDGESRLSYTEGYKVYPNSKWTHIPTKDIIAVANPRSRQNSDSLYLMYVEDEATTTEDGQTTTRKLFRHQEVTNVPSDLLHGFQFSPPHATCLDLRYDREPGRLDSHIIISTASGTGTATDVWEQLLKPMLDLCELKEGKDFALHVTSSETSVSEFVQDLLLPRANQGIHQAVLILSGDGGLVDILNGLLAGPIDPKRYKKPNVSLIPTGTGNALAHSTGTTADNTLGLRSWINGKIRELPYFHAAFSPGARVLYNEARDERPLALDAHGMPAAYGAVVCSWAFHAALVADSDTAEYRKYGAERFKMAAKQNLYPSDGSAAHAYRGKLEVLTKQDGRERWTEIPGKEHMYVLATLVSNLEAAFTISPASKPLDGKLRLVQFGPMPPEDAMTIMGAAYQGGKHVEHEAIRYEEIEGLRIDFEEEDAQWRRVCVDGKIIRVEQGGFVEVTVARQGVLDLVTLER